MRGRPGAQRPQRDADFGTWFENRRNQMRDPRSLERIRAHYEIERELSDRLRESTRGERGRLYGEVYGDLFHRVPDHPQLTARWDPARRGAYVAPDVATIIRLLPRGGTYLEVGAGDCAVARRVAGHAGRVIAVEVSGEVAPSNLPKNVELLITDSTSMPVSDRSVDLAFSDQLMEHLHPEDALEQLREIHRTLRPGGRYVFLTPNRVTGPHDVSGYFDEVATGFHLKEYTNGELAELLRSVGFSEVRAWVTLRGKTVIFPLQPLSLVEALCSRSARAHGVIGQSKRGAQVLGCRVVGTR